jgi:peptide deformylase
MSEVLTFNTEQGIVKQEVINPMPVFGEDFPMLKEVMPEFDVSVLPHAEITELMKRMKMTMKLYSGIGLSANQVGAKVRMFIIGSENFQITCINPEILSYSGEPVKMQEGCLSSPGLHMGVKRYPTVNVRYYNELGEKKEVEFSGVTAQCFQHELDHLNGVTFTSLVSPVVLQLAKQKQKKLINRMKKQK